MWESAASSATGWRKSTRSQGAQTCVEVASVSELAAVRDSKNPSGSVLVFAPAAFAAFVHSVKAGRLDLR
ncbi:protein of unknown function (DUF397) [Streptoalloteichus tenebrarius]|uniref:DUF397 domain-containing protein n=1 Tax=Streptoalloteichus tenebrarius (strain ATCC 17920 / DSM 40477 / JCM 4838 / CBS 697.72 / NBRC 16177 / NCIMB 11028 / NRRL B-12390 / A12253. 1 / ISP 5477) TaxID=1933 RepID=A0ABT1HUC6_STRSD|nr:DUF397 domain-containing protein [Streptoalloteichus tenebrarius]MCP2259120.1 protein of unknown function (DUF397) [Streptoalloteichus tenebrarius]BFF04405.1 hypothetical protein GCM10020241_60800 [Streptoalloteichus tenebrarius]